MRNLKTNFNKLINNTKFSRKFINAKFNFCFYHIKPKMSDDGKIILAILVKLMDIDRKNHLF